MQVLINIPEDTYEYYNKLANKGEQLNNLESIILNGTIIPEYHGDLVDRNDLLDSVSNDKREAFSKHQIWLKVSNYNTEVPVIIPQSHTRTEIRLATGK